jgi:DNA-binding CsgD family transcriptional regulator
VVHVRQLDPPPEWTEAGPRLSLERLMSVREVVSSWAPLLPAAAAVTVTDYPSAMTAVRTAWRAVEAMAASRATDSTFSPELLQLLLRLRQLERDLTRLELDRVRSVVSKIISVLPRLEAAAWSVAELTSVAPELVCRLGFDRALISTVDDTQWHPQAMYVAQDPSWSPLAAAEAGALPERIEPGPYEAEVIRSHKAVLANHIPDLDGPDRRPWSRSYVAAPILLDGRVVGMLHADFSGQRRLVNEVDRDLLWAFSEAFRVVLSRAVLNDRLATTQAELERLRMALDGTAAVFGPPAGLGTDRPTAGVGPVTVRVGQRQPEHRPLPETLTKREVEVLGLLAAGRTNLALARELCISEETAKQHVKHVMRKLEVTNRAEAVARWFQAGGE